MKLDFIDEPNLVFANGTHICPRRGIANYGVFDQTQLTRRQEIYLGVIGTSTCIDFFNKWLERCKSEIEREDDVKQENLRLPFCGFNRNSGFGADLECNSDLTRQLKKSDVDGLIKIENRNNRVQSAIDTYFEEIKFLAQNRHVDVIVCVIPESLYNVISSEETPHEQTLDNETNSYFELNFRRALKAKAMSLGKPLQLIRQVSLHDTTVSGQQDSATKAWNFCTAIYYKSGPTIPWKLEQDKTRPTSCAVGLSFYRSRDRQTLGTSLAQIFDELGNGLILRGTPVEIDKNDRIPRLTTQQSYDLLSTALDEYRVALKTYPARVVIHKSANFSNNELEGLELAAQNVDIDTVDFVTVMDSQLRLFRDGNYPPFRGTLVQFDENKLLLYSRGSVWYYRTYPGLYVPRPIELRVVKSDESPTFIAKEILGLTKMNWNDTQLDGKYPVTLGCSRKVGEIMKYISEYETPQIRYGYYM